MAVSTIGAVAVESNGVTTGESTTTGVLIAVESPYVEPSLPFEQAASETANTNIKKNFVIVVVY